MRVKLADETSEMKKVRVVTRRALYADKCDACGKVFQMTKWSGGDSERRLAELHGIFDRCATDKDGRGMGNMFSACVCSFDCAHQIFTGGWRNMPQFKPYAEADATLVRGELVLTAFVKNAETMRTEWEQSPSTAEHGIHPVTQWVAHDEL